MKGCGPRSGEANVSIARCSRAPGSTSPPDGGFVKRSSQLRTRDRSSDDSCSILEGRHEGLRCGGSLSCSGRIRGPLHDEGNPSLSAAGAAGAGPPRRSRESSGWGSDRAVKRDEGACQAPAPAPRGCQAPDVHSDAELAVFTGASSRRAPARRREKGGGGAANAISARPRGTRTRVATHCAACHAGGRAFECRRARSPKSCNEERE